VTVKSGTDQAHIHYKLGELSKVFFNGERDDDRIVDVMDFQNAIFRVTSPALDMAEGTWPGFPPAKPPVIEVVAPAPVAPAPVKAAKKAARAVAASVPGPVRAKAMSVPVRAKATSLPVRAKASSAPVPRDAPMETTERLQGGLLPMPVLAGGVILALIALGVVIVFLVRAL
jgi:hypothetical protein